MNKDFVRTISGIENTRGARFLNRIHIDHILLPLICAVLLFGLLILRSASMGDEGIIVSQSVRIGLGCTGTRAFSFSMGPIFIYCLYILVVVGYFRWG